MTPSKKIYGLVGHPVRHSLSPVMQNAAFASLGIHAKYELYDVEPSGLTDFLDNVSAKHISGFNVTIPHKIKVKEYLERKGQIDENAKRLGAVNTINIDKNGILHGFNTDGPGFYRSLIEDLKFEPEGKNVFSLGAGGAAMAITMYLGNGPKKIFVYDVENEKIDNLKKQYAKYYDETKFEVVEKKNFKSALSESDLLINATPIGMKDGDSSPVEKDMLHPGLYIYDLVYNRLTTQLVREASVMKLHALTGIGMLLFQGAIAFEIWTGKVAPIDVMRKALKEALKAQG